MLLLSEMRVDLQELGEVHCCDQENLPSLLRCMTNIVQVSVGSLFGRPCMQTLRGQLPHQ